MKHLINGEVSSMNKPSHTVPDIALAIGNTRKPMTGTPYAARIACKVGLHQAESGGGGHVI